MTRVVRITKRWYRLYRDGVYLGAIHNLSGSWMPCPQGIPFRVRDYPTAWGAAWYVVKFARPPQEGEDRNVFKMLGSPMTPENCGAFSDAAIARRLSKTRL